MLSLALAASTLGPDRPLIERELCRVNNGLSGLRDAHRGWPTSIGTAP
jgi:hypothetical protein